MITFAAGGGWGDYLDLNKPRIVIYENGDVIFVKDTPVGPAYFHTTLDGGALSAWRRQMQKVFSLKAIKDFYTAEVGGDLPSVGFSLREGNKVVITYVAGWDGKTIELPWKAIPKSTDAPPAELVQLYRMLCAFRSQRCEVWNPKYIEVQFTQAPEPTDPLLEWPKSWPSFSSDRAVKIGDGYSIYLDYAQLSQLRQLLPATRKGVVEMAGKRWRVSWRSSIPFDK